jgi:hypothetical protein
MCPVCAATAALIAVGATTTGGITTLVVKRLRLKRAAAVNPDNTKRSTDMKGNNHESPENGPAK